MSVIQSSEGAQEFTAAAEGSERELNQRFNRAIALCEGAAARAMGFWQRSDTIQVENKGIQDWVSEADREVEQHLVEALQAEFPSDAIVGEEYGRMRGDSGYTWIIDPIDGTTNFVNHNHGWGVVLACIDAEGIAIGIFVDPLAGETFTARRGKGAWLNGRPIRVAEAASLAEGTVSTGHNMRIEPEVTAAVIGDLIGQQGMFARNGSGAMHLAWVAAGRLIGYIEKHMNSWDCLAGLLLIEEAGGRVQPFDIAQMIEQGGSVVAGSPGIYPSLVAIAERRLG